MEEIDSDSKIEQIWKINERAGMFSFKTMWYTMVVVPTAGQL